MIKDNKNTDILVAYTNKQAVRDLTGLDCIDDSDFDSSQVEEITDFSNPEAAEEVRKAWQAATIEGSQNTIDRLKETLSGSGADALNALKALEERLNASKESNDTVSLMETSLCLYLLNGYIEGHAANLDELQARIGGISDLYEPKSRS